MRRKDREMNEEFAYGVVDKCEWAVLSVIDADAKPYCVPLSIVRDGQNIFFHSAKNGFKIECLRARREVCLSCVGDTYRLKDMFTTEYESAIVRGTAEEVTDDSEKIRALRLLSERHTPTNMEEFNDAIAGSLSRTGVWKISISQITGKRKKYDRNKQELKYGRSEV